MNNNSLTHKKSWPHRGMCLLLAALTGCATARPLAFQQNSDTLSGPDTNPQVVYNWGVKRDSSKIVADPLVKPGYLLSLRCPEDNKLDGDYRVEFDGTLALPYNVTMNTTGATLSEVEKKLADLYHPYFAALPHITLQVKEQRYWLDVRGLVEKPGRYLVDPDASLDTVIGLAGGLSKEPVPTYVRIQKGPKVFGFDLKQYYAGQSNTQILGWFGGEVIFFQEESTSLLGDKTGTNRKLIYLLGEVRKPGAYPLDPGTDLVDTVVEAGGFTTQADLDHIEIIRPSEDGKVSLELSWKDFQDAPAPQQGDIIMIHADRTTAIEKKTSLWVGIIGVVASVVMSTVIVLSYNAGRF